VLIKKEQIDNFLQKYLKLKIRKLNKSKFKSIKKRFDYQSNIIKFQFTPNMKVLDIGSGADPFPYATHLVDKFPGETSHRVGDAIIDDRPFIKADIVNLPFEDKYFDFTYCSHVLEHVDNPFLACKEIMRVSKAGYIETPSKTSDIMFNFTRLKNHHKWFVEVLGNKLVFLEWGDSARRDLGSNYFFQEFHSDFETKFQTYFYNNLDLFVNSFEWKDHFDVIVIDKNGNLLKESNA